MKYVFNIDRYSTGHTWLERFLVEVMAATADEARAHVAFMLSDHEQIVSPLLRIV